MLVASCVAPSSDQAGDAADGGWDGSLDAVGPLLDGATTDGPASETPDAVADATADGTSGDASNGDAGSDASLDANAPDAAPPLVCPGSCPAGKKYCNDLCVAIDDPAYGCSDNSCGVGPMPSYGFRFQGCDSLATTASNPLARLGADPVQAIIGS